MKLSRLLINMKIIQDNFNQSLKVGGIIVHMVCLNLISTLSRGVGGNIRYGCTEVLDLTLLRP